MKTKSKSRRNFLLAASVGSAGVVAGVATLRSKPRVAAAEPDAAGGTAYRASEHVLKYYKTTEA